MKKVTAKFLNHTCWVYTITAVLLLLLQMAIAGSAEETVIRPEAFLLVLPFACGFALANLVYTWKDIPYVVRLFIHFVMVVMWAYLFLYLPIASENASSSKLTFVLILAAAYWICMLPYLIVVSIVKRKKNATTEYQSAFKKNGK